MTVKIIVSAAGQISIKAVHLIAQQDPIKSGKRSAAICRAEMSYLVPATQMA